MNNPRLGSALALSWCDLCALVADPNDSARRREEYRSHVADARTAGVGEWRLVAEVLRGAFDDVRWCNESRAAAGRPSLAVAVLVEFDLAVVMMTAMMASVFVLSLFPALHAVEVLTELAAGTLLAITAGRAAHTLFRRTRGSPTDA